MFLASDDLRRDRELLTLTSYHNPTRLLQNLGLIDICSCQESLQAQFTEKKPPMGSELLLLVFCRCIHSTHLPGRPVHSFMTHYYFDTGSGVFIGKLIWIRMDVSSNRFRNCLPIRSLSQGELSVIMRHQAAPQQGVKRTRIFKHVLLATSPLGTNCTTQRVASS